jgi:thymidylate kinase
MLCIVEGLNGAGKTTVIEQLHEKGTESLNMDLPSFSNPVKWAKNIHSGSGYTETVTAFKKKMFLTQEMKDAYVFAVYETVLHRYLGLTTLEREDGVYLLDRSFISSLVYGTITKECFAAIMELYCNTLNPANIHPVYYDFEILFIDTPIDKCIERTNRRLDEKSYACIDTTKQEQYYMHYRRIFAEYADRVKTTLYTGASNDN